MTTERNIPVLYLVIPCYNEEAVLPETTKRLTEKMHTMIRAEQVDPESRILKQVHINDAAESDRIFSMLMGEDVAPRREFIEENATYANIDA